MTEQELRESLISVAPSAIYANESEIVAIVEIAKAYADAQTSARDAEIAQLKAELKWANEQLAGIKTDMQHGRLIEAAQVKEATELRAEIKRLRDALSPAPVTPSDKCECVYSFQGDLVKQCETCKESRFIPAPVTEDKFSVSAYPKECVPTIEQLTENDSLTMMERLEKRMPPFHRIDSPQNEDQE